MHLSTSERWEGQKVHGITGTLVVGSTRIPQFAFIDSPVLSYQLMMMGGGLLLVAAILMTLQRKRSDSFENSALRHELVSYLSRIANALDRMDPSKNGENPAQVLRRLVHPKLSHKVREMPKHHTK
jgi:hypothetical protein